VTDLLAAILLKKFRICGYNVIKKSNFGHFFIRILAISYGKYLANLVTNGRMPSTVT